MGKPAVAADVIVGSIAAELASKIAVHPLDTLKTRLQYLVLPRTTSSAKRIPLLGDIRVGLQILAAATRSPHHSMIEPGSTPHVPKHRLVLNAARSLYRGLVPQVVGVLPIALVYMPTYELASATVKGTYLEHTPVAGLATGAALGRARALALALALALLLAPRSPTPGAPSSRTCPGACAPGCRSASLRRGG